MIRKPRRDARLYRALARAITPAVLIAGLLLLAVYHFNGILKTTAAEDNLFHGVTAFSSGRLELDFQRDAGIDRPAILWNRLGVMTFSEWDSIIAVDGHTDELWNNFHGYSVDAAHNTMYATTSGYGWQVTEIARLVDDHTITVTFELTARNVGTAVPRHVELLVNHHHSNGQPGAMAGFWYYPQVNGASFTAEELPLSVQNPAVPYQPDSYQSFNPDATTSLSVAGPALAHTPIALNNAASAVLQGHSQSWASSFTTHYVLDNPPPDQLLMLGTETITVQPLASGSGTPVILPLPTGQVSSPS